jgi:4-hydroxy-tetrahydrodipicolinate synthase
LTVSCFSTNGARRLFEEPELQNPGLPKGIVPLLETPFLDGGGIDYDSLLRLTEATIAGGANGLTAPLVASEVHSLSNLEREEVVTQVARALDGRLPFIVGASSNEPATCRQFAKLAEVVGATAYLVAVPNSLYGQPSAMLDFFHSIVSASDAPLIIQDLQWGGPGLDMDEMRRLRDELPTLAGLKIETLPAGPKYTMVRGLVGNEFYVSGGWACIQLIEALDRGVDAMIPESALIRLFSAIYRAYASSDRQEAIRIVWELSPVVAFSNQDIFHSIAFFKRMLVRKGVLKCGDMRPPSYRWDHFNLRIADELIDYYLALEARYPVPGDQNGVAS